MKRFILILLTFALACSNGNIKEGKNNLALNNERIIEKNIVESEAQEEITDLIFFDKIYDFGLIKHDSIVTALYTFINTGEHNLIIKSVNPDCTCTGYTLSKDTIMPNDTAFIQLTLNTHDKFGEVKAYTIVTANTEDKLYKLTLKGDVGN